MEFKLSFKCFTRDNLDDLKWPWKQIALLLFLTMVQCHETRIQTASTLTEENSLRATPLVATIAQEEYYESQLFETQIHPNDVTSLKAAPLVAISTTGTVQNHESQYLETQIQSNVATLMTTAPSATRSTANQAQKSDVGVLQTLIKLRFGATSTDATPLDTGTTLTSVKADYNESHFLETQIQPNVAEIYVISTLLAAKSTIMQTEYDSQDIGTQIQPNDGTFATSRQVENDSQFVETQIQPNIVKSTMGLMEYDSQILDTMSTNVLSKLSGVIKTILRTISETVIVVQAVETKSISSRQLGRKYFFLRRNPSSWGKN